MTIIHGNASNNLLLGSNRADAIFGHEGNDTIAGLAGNDSLEGGDGNDLLVGGPGADVLAGGDGADTFALTNYMESLDTAEKRDTIVDFASGVDLLDFRGANSGQAVTFANVSIEDVAAGEYIIHVDQNLDGIFEYGMHILGSRPVETDFLLG